MGAPWKMPEELEPYRSFLRDTGPGVEEVMSHYPVAAADIIGTAEGRALSVNAQIGLLAMLRSAGLLKDVPSCSLEKKP